MGRRKSRLPKVFVVAVVGLGVWGAVSVNRGCDRTAARGNKAIVLNPTTRTSPPATRPAPTVEATAAADATAVPPATSKPLAATRLAEKRASQMTINSVLVPFPEAKLLLRRDGDKLNACLVSNDPPEVIAPTYQGNRYYFEMALDAVDDLANLSDAEFRYKAPTAESQDTPNGIFLDGDRQHLEPYDIQVTFDKDGDHVVADIRGQFIYFPKGNVVGQSVLVSARLAARPEMKQGK